MLVIGSYRMGFTIAERKDRSHLVVFIDYQFPHSDFSRGIGLLFGKAYAVRCTRRTATDAEMATTGMAGS